MTKNNNNSTLAKQCVNTSNLRNALLKLREDSDEAFADLRNAHHKTHLFLGGLYLWWRQANQVEGYLEEEYDKLGRTFKTVCYGTNFAPLLRLATGDNNLSNQDVDRYSRALNRVDEQFTSQPAHYAKGGAIKLAAYIKQSGGISALAGYYSPKAQQSNPTSLANAAITGSTMRTAGKASLLPAAREFVDIANPANYPLPKYIATNENGIGTFLAIPTGSGTKVIPVEIGESIINAALVEFYRQQFGAQKPVLRPLLEVLQTQCLPTNLQKYAGKLDQFRRGKNSNAKHRLMYLHDSGEFLLSHTNTDASVVSVVKPAAPVLENCASDLVLPYWQLRTLQREFLQCWEFNSYVPTSANAFTRANQDDTTAYSLGLWHINCMQSESAKQMLQHLTNLNFLSASYDSNNNQVIPGLSGEITESLWSVELPASWFSKLQNQFLSKWLDSHGRHINREVNQTLRVDFESDSITFHFVCREGKFESSETVALDTISSGVATTQTIASVDLILPLRSISMLPVSGNVSICLNSHCINIEFSTSGPGGSHHRIYIPVLTDEGVRSSVPFGQQCLSASEPTYEYEYFEDDEIAIAEEWAEQRRVA